MYAAAERFGGNQDGAKEHLVDALEVRSLNLFVINKCVFSGKGS